MAIKLSTLLTRIRSRLTAEIGRAFARHRRPGRTAGSPQQRCTKRSPCTVSRPPTCARARRRRSARDRRRRGATRYRLRPKGARADSSSALDVENLIQGPDRPRMGEGDDLGHARRSAANHLHGHDRDWPLAEWQVSEISFSVYRNQAAN